jgi:hypothetical protein
MDYHPLRARLIQAILTARGPQILLPATDEVLVEPFLGSLSSETTDSTIGAGFGTIATGETVLVPAVMPAGQATGSFMLRSPLAASASLTFGLLRPDGTPVSITDPQVVQESGMNYAGMFETRYTLVDPMQGEWTMSVTAPAAPPGGWRFDVEAVVQGQIEVSARTSAGHYDVGATFEIEAQVVVGGLPYTGATVQATITKPDATTTTITLLDSGGGTYEDTFSETLACGRYVLSVVASGHEGGVPFSRIARTIAVAAVPGNVILDPCQGDSDLDTLSDEAEINFLRTNPASSDTDADGCRDDYEIGVNPQTGGDRDPVSPWDFFDVTGDNAIDLQDTLTILDQFGALPGDTRYDPAFDRYAPDAAKPWRTAAAVDEGIGIDLQDALLSLRSFGHSCAP